MFLGIPAQVLLQLGLKMILGGVDAYQNYNDGKKAEFLDKYGDLLEALENVPEAAKAIRDPDSVDTGSLKMKTLTERVAEKEASNL